MFDKLIASEPAGAEFRKRTRYFAASSIVVGILFVTAVVVSIFAAEYGLGSETFEVVELEVPLDVAAQQADRPSPRRPEPGGQTISAPNRPSIANINETPLVPLGPSVIPNRERARSEGERFTPLNAGTGPFGGTGRGEGGPQANGNDGGLEQSVEQRRENEDNVDLPPVVSASARPRPPQSLGVVNGRATHLETPPYPPHAQRVNAGGKVSVQVTIDEAGRVISARAIDGHPLLRDVSEQAALRSRFTQTTLSKVPVKVTGVIIYNFTR